MLEPYPIIIYRDKRSTLYLWPTGNKHPRIVHQVGGQKVCYKHTDTPTCTARGLLLLAQTNLDYPNSGAKQRVRVKVPKWAMSSMCVCTVECIVATIYYVCASNGQ